MIVVALLVVTDRTSLWPAMRSLTNQLYLWGIVLASVTVALGALNVGWIHTKRVLAGDKNWLYSSALVATMLAVLIGGLLNPAGAQSPFVNWVFQSIILPGEATLFALLVFFMASAAFLFLRTGREGGSWMLLGALLMLTAQVPVASIWMPEGVVDLVSWVLDVPGMATLRGVLLGGSVAAFVVGVRFMFTAR